MTLSATLEQPATELLCSHCGQTAVGCEVREDLVFCCHGCETAYGIIHSSGLADYYKIRGEQEGVKGLAFNARYEEFDDDVFRAMYIKPLQGGLLSVDLFLEGVHCAACIWLIERLPRMIDGVVNSRLDFGRSIVNVTWDPTRVGLSAIGCALAALGYRPHPARDDRSREARRLEDRRRLQHVAIAGACAGNAMLLALALYSGVFDSMEAEFKTLFRWLSLGVTSVSLAWPGRVFFSSAFRALKARAVSLDLPIAIGLLAGWIWGIHNTIRGIGEVYFDSLSVLVFALLVGRWIQLRQTRRATDALELVSSFTPSRARLVEGDRSRFVPVEALKPEQMIEIAPGETIPADGVIELGATTIDQSMLTGESKPVAVGTSHRVCAGTINMSSMIRVRVSTIGEMTRMGRLLASVAECSRQKPRTVQLADKVSGVFAIAMIFLSVLTALVWINLGSWHQAAEYAVALLIVTCPCALGLATPLTFTAALGKAARIGMLIKGGDVIERMTRRHTQKTIFLDKTGTLTKGRFRIIQWFGDEAAGTLAAAAERECHHPVADALRERFTESASLQVHDFTLIAGSGVRAHVNGLLIEVGKPAFIRELANDPQNLLSQLDESSCSTHIAIAVDSEIRAVAALDDQLREDSEQAVRHLIDTGWNVRILSGDSYAAALNVGRTLGLRDEQIIAEATPEQKLEVIKSSQLHSVTVMVGDGVNDAAALAASDVGIAVHGGAEASLAAADMYLSKPGIASVTQLIDGCARTMTVIHRNLIVSILYNAGAAVLAITGFIHPIVAAVLMPVSSLTVIFLAFKSRSFGVRS